MSPLFCRNEEKAARKAAARVEIDKLRALGVDDLTVDLMPALGLERPTHHEDGRGDEVAWLSSASRMPRRPQVHHQLSPFWCEFSLDDTARPAFMRKVAHGATEHRGSAPLGAANVGRVKPLDAPDLLIDNGSTDASCR